MIDFKKSWIKAIDNRISRRTYTEENLKEVDVLPILKLIDEINKNTGLNIQYVKDAKDGISGFKASYGLISGAKSFIALVGNKNIISYKEKLGYYGEMLVLEATNLGMGTCWVGGTYNKEECKKSLIINEDEELVCVIALGYTQKELSIKEKVVSKLNKKDKSFNDILISKTEDLPSWVEKGVECVIKSPSALNKNPIGYEFDDNKVKAIITKSNHGYEEIDLGISMLHFRIGAYSEGHNGDWKCEDGEYIFY